MKNNMLNVVLKDIRESLDWSIEYLAQKADLSLPTLKNVERGLAPTSKTLTKILKAYCLNIDDIIDNPKLTDEDRLFLENKRINRSNYSWGFR